MATGERKQALSPPGVLNSAWKSMASRVVQDIILWGVVTCPVEFRYCPKADG